MVSFEQRFELAAAGGRGDGGGVVGPRARIATTPPLSGKLASRRRRRTNRTNEGRGGEMAIEMTQELPEAGTAGEEGNCEVLQGADGPVYFLHQGLLFIVHDLLGRWTEPGEVHWLVSASVGRFGEPTLYRLRCVLPEVGPAAWTVRRAAPGQF